MKATSFAIALVLAGIGWAQDSSTNEPAGGVSVAQETGQVTIASRGLDVRGVLFDLFTQGKKSFVLEPNVRFVLYLALTGVEFDEALEIVCHTAGLKYELSNEIYYISKGVQAMPVKPKVEVAPKPLGRLTDQDLIKSVTTRLPRTDLRDVFAELSRQTGVAIEVDKQVPAYKVDAFLIGTSLKYAMEVLTKSADLVLVRTENKTLRVEPKAKKTG